MEEKKTKSNIQLCIIKVNYEQVVTFCWKEICLKTD